MEYEDVLAVNEGITLVVVEGDKSGSYPSRIEDVRPDAIVVATPTCEGSPLELREGARVCVQVLQKDAMYTLDTVVEATIAYPFPVLQLAMPAEIRRHQRRGWARVDTALPVRYRCAVPPGAKSRATSYRGSATNVSAGGVLILTRQFGPEVEPGAQVDVEIELPEGGVHAEGSIVRMSSEQAPTDDYVRIAVEFKTVNEKQRDILAKYVLQRQLELRRRGLL